jgi:hypothetical protein
MSKHVAAIVRETPWSPLDAHGNPVNVKKHWRPSGAQRLYVQNFVSNMHYIKPSGTRPDGSLTPPKCSFVDYLKQKRAQLSDTVTRTAKRLDPKRQVAKATAPEVGRKLGRPRRVRGMSADMRFDLGAADRARLIEKQAAKVANDRYAVRSNNGDITRRYVNSYNSPVVTVRRKLSQMRTSLGLPARPWGDIPVTKLDAYEITSWKNLDVMAGMDLIDIGNGIMALAGGEGNEGEGIGFLAAGLLGFWVDKVVVAKWNSMIKAGEGSLRMAAYAKNFGDRMRDFLHLGKMTTMTSGIAFSLGPLVKMLPGAVGMVLNMAVGGVMEVAKGQNVMAAASTAIKSGVEFFANMAGFGGAQGLTDTYCMMAGMLGGANVNTCSSSGTRHASQISVNQLPLKTNGGCANQVYGTMDEIWPGTRPYTYRPSDGVVQSPDELRKYLADFKDPDHQPISTGHKSIQQFCMGKYADGCKVRNTDELSSICPHAGSSAGVGGNYNECTDEDWGHFSTYTSTTTWHAGSWCALHYRFQHELDDLTRYLIGYETEVWKMSPALLEQSYRDRRLVPYLSEDSQMYVDVQGTTLQCGISSEEEGASYCIEFPELSLFLLGNRAGKAVKGPTCPTDHGGDPYVQVPGHSAVKDEVACCQWAGACTAGLEGRKVDAYCRLGYDDKDGEALDDDAAEHQYQQCTKKHSMRGQVFPNVVGVGGHVVYCNHGDCNMREVSTSPPIHFPNPPAPITAEQNMDDFIAHCAGPDITQPCTSVEDAQEQVDAGYICQYAGYERVICTRPNKQCPEGYTDCTLYPSICGCSEREGCKISTGGVDYDTECPRHGCEPYDNKAGDKVELRMCKITERLPYHIAAFIMNMVPSPNVGRSSQVHGLRTSLGQFKLMMDDLNALTGIVWEEKSVPTNTLEIRHIDSDIDSMWMKNNFVLDYSRLKYWIKKYDDSTQKGKYLEKVIHAKPTSNCAFQPMGGKDYGADGFTYRHGFIQRLHWATGQHESGTLGEDHDCYSQCGLGDGDCDVNSDCLDGLECGATCLGGDDERKERLNQHLERDRGVCGPMELSMDELLDDSWRDDVHLTYNGPHAKEEIHGSGDDCCAPPGVSDVASTQNERWDQTRAFGFPTSKCCKNALQERMNEDHKRSTKAQLHTAAAFADVLWCGDGYSQLDGTTVCDRNSWGQETFENSERKDAPAFNCNKLDNVSVQRSSTGSARRLRLGELGGAGDVMGGVAMPGIFYRHRFYGGPEDLNHMGADAIRFANQCKRRHSNTPGSTDFDQQFSYAFGITPGGTDLPHVHGCAQINRLHTYSLDPTRTKSDKYFDKLNVEHASTSVTPFNKHAVAALPTEVIGGTRRHVEMTEYTELAGQAGLVRYRQGAMAAAMYLAEEVGMALITLVFCTPCLVAFQSFKYSASLMKKAVQMVVKGLQVFLYHMVIGYSAKAAGTAAAKLVVKQVATGAATKIVSNVAEKGFFKKLMSSTAGAVSSAAGATASTAGRMKKALAQRLKPPAAAKKAAKKTAGKLRNSKAGQAAATLGDTIQVLSSISAIGTDAASAIAKQSLARAGESLVKIKGEWTLLKKGLKGGPTTVTLKSSTKGVKPSQISQTHSLIRNVLTAPFKVVGAVIRKVPKFGDELADEMTKRLLTLKLDAYLMKQFGNPTKWYAKAIDQMIFVTRSTLNMLLTAVAGIAYHIMMAAIPLALYSSAMIMLKQHRLQDTKDLYRRFCYSQDSHGGRHVAFGRTDYDFLVCTSQHCAPPRREVDVEYDSDDYPSPIDGDPLNCPDGYNETTYSYRAPLAQYVWCRNDTCYPVVPTDVRDMNGADDTEYVSGNALFGKLKP